MEIYSYPNTPAQNRRHTEGLNIYSRAGMPLKKASGGEDILEISDAARGRCERDRIIRLDAARVKKAARELDLVIKRIIGGADTSSRRDRIEKIKAAIQSGSMNFNGGDALHETAENIIAMMV